MSLIIAGNSPRRVITFASLLAMSVLAATPGSDAAAAEKPRSQPGTWTRHTIDGSARGADGVRLADINGDGLPDIATGFEESGVTRVYLNPGPARAKAVWPAVTVGAAADVEDAVFADLDGDGGMDVISSSEGKTRAIWIHWGPIDPRRQLEPSAWQTEAIPAVAGRQWMFCAPHQLDGRGGLDLLVGSKGGDACVGWLQSPPNPRQVASWTFHEIRPAGWVMSLIPADMDGDGKTDLVLSDRKRTRTGVFWLKNPGPGPAQSRPWQEHVIGSIGREVMFATLADLDQDGLEDVLVSVAPREIHWHRRLDRTGTRWESRVIPQPENTGTAKAVAVGDLDLDGRMDLVFDCEGAAAPKHGLMWLANANPLDAGGWIAHPLSGVDGIKHDLIALVDLDGDGDPDVLTTEEAKRLGVIWYENPARSREPR